MKKKVLKLAGFLLVIGFMCFSAISAQAANLASYVSKDGLTNNVLPAPGEQDFVLVNKTGVEIYALYVTPNSAKQWGDDVLGVDTLAANEYTTIVFSPSSRATYWDLRIEDEDGNYIEWDKFNLKAISKITLYYANGKATAITE
ncbi:hypothetical protein BH10ACI1_BH10ACI1_31150 [soil metagenome]